jgi:hypothetical protein
VIIVDTPRRAADPDPVGPLRTALAALVNTSIDLDDGRPSRRWWRALAATLEHNAQPDVDGWALAAIACRHTPTSRDGVLVTVRSPAGDLYGWALHWNLDARALYAEAIG